MAVGIESCPVPGFFSGDVRSGRSRFCSIVGVVSGVRYNPRIETLAWQRKMTSNPDSDFNNQPLSDHVVVSGLVQKVLDHFSVRSVSDLCRLDIDIVAKEKGVGVKKVETIRALIEQAHRLTGFTPSDSRSERVQQFSSNAHLDQPLVYVPSFLKESFRRLELDTVSKLLCLEEGDLAGMPSWGEKKVVAALALRDLYQSIFSKNDPDSDALMCALVPEAVLPDNSLASQPIKSFIESSSHTNLKGKAVQEAFDLRSLLHLWIYGDKQHEDIAELDWRDVPLQVNSRVRDFLDKHSLRAIGDLEQLATRGWLTHPQNGSRVSALDADNFGGTSLESLRNEVLRLKADGLRMYRGKVICDIENLEVSEWEWESVPLRLRGKAKSLLRNVKSKELSMFIAQPYARNSPVLKPQPGRTWVSWMVLPKQSLKSCVAS
ncbi:hypothetical protein SH528x_005223 [Novipirellula sp. SH528]|uniref:hypothetical protein n=1 Tax=Novipirellula sp. SH528 TaxID=3454466 RepID=UPI003F9F310E